MELGLALLVWLPPEPMVGTLSVHFQHLYSSLPSLLDSLDKIPNPINSTLANLSSPLEFPVQP